MLMLFFPIVSAYVCMRVCVRVRVRARARPLIGLSALCITVRCVMSQGSLEGRGHILPVIELSLGQLSPSLSRPL